MRVLGPVLWLWELDYVYLKRLLTDEWTMTVRGSWCSWWMTGEKERDIKIWNHMTTWLDDISRVLGFFFFSLAWYDMYTEVNILWSTNQWYLPLIRITGSPFPTCVEHGKKGKTTVVLWACGVMGWPWCRSGSPWLHYLILSFIIIWVIRIEWQFKCNGQRIGLRGPEIHSSGR